MISSFYHLTVRRGWAWGYVYTGWLLFILNTPLLNKWIHSFLQWIHAYFDDRAAWCPFLRNLFFFFWFIIWLPLSTFWKRLIQTITQHTLHCIHCYPLHQPFILIARLHIWMKMNTVMSINITEQYAKNNSRKYAMLCMRSDSDDWIVSS